MTTPLLVAGLPVAAILGLTWLGQTAVILAVGLLAGRLCRRSGPAVQSAVYRTTLAAVLACPLASTLLASARVVGLTLRLPPALNASLAAPLMAAVPLAPTVGETRPTPLEPPMAGRDDSEPGAALATRAAAPASTSTFSGGSSSFSALILTGLAVWGLGTVLLGLRLAVEVRQVRRLRARAVAVEPAVEELCRSLAVGMGVVAPPVRRAPLLASPCITGLRHPMIFLPDETDGDLRAVLVHELAHLARGDLWWNWLRHATVALLWFQPLAWMLSRRLEIVAEEVCDDYVVQSGGDRSTYAGLLLAIAGRTLPPVAAPAIGMVAPRSLLARRVVRILDSARTPSTRAGRCAASLAVAAGLGGTLAVGLVGIGPRAPAAFADEPALVPIQAVAGPDTATITVTGRIVGPDDRPIPGAVIRAVAGRGVLREPDRLGRPRYETRELTRTVADPDGQYTLSYPKPEIGPDGAPVWDIAVYAQAPGYGLSPLLGGRIRPLTLDDVPVTGRLVDPAGQPVAGASIRATAIWLTRPDRPGDPDTLPVLPERTSRVMRIGFGSLDLIPPVTTDAAGRFRIEGIGRERLIDLDIRAAGFALKQVYIATRLLGETRDGRPVADGNALEDSRPYGADCAIVVEPTRIIAGTIRDAATSEPIPGVLVNLAQLARGKGVLPGDITARTDAEGRYRLVGMPPATDPAVSVYPPLNRPYFDTEYLKIPVTPGVEPITFDVTLKAGVWVAGRVTDVRTGEPVAAAVDYFPFLDNANAKGYPNFRPETSMSVALKTRHRTDREGRFRVVALPGRGVVTARTDSGAYRVGVGAEAIAPDMVRGKVTPGQLPTFDRIFTNRYQAIRAVDIPPGVAEFARDLPVDPGGSVLVRLIDAAGQPVTGVNIPTGWYPPGGESGPQTTGAKAEARIGGLEPDVGRLVVFRQPDRDLGAILNLPADGPIDGRELTVVLRPTATITGRLLADGGKPASAGQAQVQVPRIGVSSSVFRTFRLGNATLEAGGRFRIKGIPAGASISLDLLVPREPQQPTKGFKVAVHLPDLAPTPGAVLDIGTFDLVTGKPVAEPK